MKSRLLKSYIIGFLIIASLRGFAWFGATHQDMDKLSDAAYVVAGIIDLPVMALYGMDPQGEPHPVAIVIIYLLEACIPALLVYLIFFSRKNLS